MVSELILKRSDTLVHISNYKHIPHSNPNFLYIFSSSIFIFIVPNHNTTKKPGGVIGTFAALYLNRLGVKVTLCEKGRIAGEQSSRNWGWVRCCNRDPAELPIAMEAQRLWKEIDIEVEGRCGFQQRGIHYLCATEEKMKAHEKWLETAKKHELDSHFISNKELQKRFPSMKTKYVGALFTPSDGRAEPFTAVPTVAQLAQLEGVTIRENCAVRDLNIGEYLSDAVRANVVLTIIQRVFINYQ